MNILFPKTTKISNCIEYMDLKLGPEKWAKKIIEMSKIKTENINLKKVDNKNLNEMLKIFSKCSHYEKE